MKWCNSFWFLGMPHSNPTVPYPFMMSKLKYFFRYAFKTFWSEGLSILPPYIPSSKVPYNVYKFRFFVVSYYFTMLSMIYKETFRSEYEN